MQSHTFPTFTATLNGIHIDGLPLTKSLSQNLTPETLRYVKRAEELLAKVHKEGWDNRSSHATDNVPLLAQAQMMLALASPQPFEKYNHHHRGPGHGGGQFTTADLDGVATADLKNPRFKGMSRLEIKKQKFVDAHLAVTERAAKNLNVPVANILGLAALESGWGRGDFVLDGPSIAESTNSYFGMAAPQPFMNGTTQAAGSNHLVASFANYDDALKAFVATKGDIIRNISDPTEFATAIQIKGKFGIDMTTGKFDPTYIPKLVGTINHISDAIAYAQKHPL